ncbi:hypothetical protein C2S51_019332 [Perilla frutescens var. frutescens]|nr:hypothetical protein C2S51_019332 [Perilla frutescens var. frutescens]
MAPTTPSPPPLIQKACSNSSRTIDTELCLRVLESIPKVATTKDLQSLAIAIIESGISNSTDTRTHIEAALKGSGAANECKYAYDQVVERLGEALHEVKIHEYLYPSYELLTASTDYVKLCDAALAKEKVEDEVISIGNKVVPIFGISACLIVEELEGDHSRVAPTPSA